jgi:hypothetical protein
MARPVACGFGIQATFGVWPRIARMASPERIYQGSVRAFSFVFIALGLLLLIATLVNGGGPLSVGTLLGLAFLAVGAGRLWIASRT